MNLQKKNEKRKRRFDDDFDDDDVDDEVDERNVGRYRRERLRARLGKLTDDNQIRRIEQQLQYARKRQRKRHCNEFFEQRSACHVHVFGDGLVM